MSECESSGCGSSIGGDVGGAFSGVALLSGGLAVGALCEGVEAGCALELALRTC